MSIYFWVILPEWKIKSKLFSWEFDSWITEKTRSRCRLSLQRTAGGIRPGRVWKTLCRTYSKVWKGKSQVWWHRRTDWTEEGKERIVQRVHSNFGEAGWHNLRVRCWDLEQLCLGIDCESKRWYKIHIQERIWSESIEMGFDGTRAEMLGCFFARKITVIMIEYFVVWAKVNAR